MPVVAKAKRTKKQRKYGRNAVSCAAYAARNQRERNKALRLRRHLVRFPADRVASAAVDRCVVAVRGH